MKKFISLFVFLLVLVGQMRAALVTVDTGNPLTSVEQISTSKYYVLYNQGHGAYMYVNSSNQVRIKSTLPTDDEGLLPFIIRFVPNTNAKSDGTAYQLKFYNGSYLPWQSNGGANYVSTTMGLNGSNDEGFLPAYNSTESYFSFQVYKGGSSRNYYFNGNELVNGDGTFTFWGNGTGANSRYTIYEVTWELPFEYYDDYASIDTWYNARMHSNQTHYLYSNSGALAFNDSYAGTYDEKYMWGFVGNPIDGFQVYNFSTGSSAAIDNANPCTLSADGLTTKFRVRSGAAGTQGTSADGYFCLYVDAGSYLNYQGGAIKRWTSADEGSTILINKAATFANSSGISYSKRYAVVNKRSMWTSNRTALKSVGETTGRTMSTSESLNQFAFVSSGGSTYLYNVGEAKFVDVDGTLKTDLSTVTPISSTIDAATVGAPYQYFFCFKSDKNINVTTAPNLQIDHWSTHDEGNMNALIEVGDFDPSTALSSLGLSTVTYNYKIGDEVVYTESQLATVGTAYPEPLKPYGITNSTPTETVPNTSTTKDITCTYDGSITFSTSYSDATWYTWYMRSGYAHYNAEATPNKFPENAELVGSSDYRFAFIGNPFGFKVINAAAGDGNYLTGRQPAASGKSTPFGFTTDASDATVFAVWPSTATNTYGPMYFQVQGSQGEVVNDIDQGLGFWHPDATSAQTDVGSQITLGIAYTSCNVTYNYKIGDEVVYTEVRTAPVGEAYPTPLKPYGITNSTPTGTVPNAETASVDIACTYDGSIRFSASYSDAIWYSWKMRSGYAHYVSTETSHFPETSYLNKTEDYRFAFIGNPFGFKVINAAAGDGYYMTGRQETTAEHGTSPFSFSNDASAATVFAVWPSTAENTYGPMYFQVQGSPGEVVNDINQGLGIWHPDATQSQSDVGSQITLALATLPVTSVTEGRYVIWNRGLKRFLVQSGEALNRTDRLGVSYDVWDVVATETAGQYLIRNEVTGKYIKWNETYNANFTLVDDPSEAVRVEFSTSTDYIYYTDGQSVAIKRVDYTSDPLFHMSPYYHVTRWRKSDSGGSDWSIYPADIAAGTKYLVRNRQTGTYATYAGDDAMLTFSAKGAVDGTNSVWTLTTSGSGYLVANNGSSGKTLADLVTAPNFNATGVPWYIQQDRFAPSYYNISNKVDFSGSTCWNRQVDNVKYYSADYYGGACEGSMWSFVTVDEYYQNALYYLLSLYDEEHKNDVFYISETAYNTLIGAAHSSSAEKIAAANAMYNVLNDLDHFNWPEDGKDYLLLNHGIKTHNILKNRYVYTNDANTELKLGETYNSSYFWHVSKEAGSEKILLNQCCYGTTGGEFPEAAKRYISDAQDGSLSHWVYTTSQPTDSLSLEIYRINNNSFLGNAIIYDATTPTPNQMNGNYNASVVLTWNDRGDVNGKWQFISVEEASGPLLAAAAAALAAYTEAANAGTLSEFYLTPEGATAITTAKNNLIATPNYVNYYILEKLLNAADSYYQLASGRYLVRNYNFNVEEQGRYEAYLSSLTNPMGVVEEAITYWSIWDIDSLGNGEYTMRCEGNRHILTPMRTMDDAEGTRKDDGYLFYNADGTNDVTRCRIGTPNEAGGDVKTLRFYPAVSFQAQIPSAASVSGSYAVIAAKGREAQSRYIQMRLHSGTHDHIVVESPYAQNHNNEGTSFFWQFIPISSASQVNHEGTHHGESDMFLREVNGLEGYVGGVVTLHDVGSVPCLNDIVQLRNAAATALTNGTELNYTSGYDATTTSAPRDSAGVWAFRDIVKKINNIKTNSATKKYYQDLRPTENIDGVDVTHPFFLENVCGWRPSYGSRLTEFQSDKWHTEPAEDVLSGAGIFYSETGTDATKGAFYKLSNQNGNYLRNNDGNIRRTTDVGQALRFTIDAVIPGMWQMRDIDKTDGWPYLTITGNNGSVVYDLMYYNFSEISTIWKFSTFNELDDIVLKVDPDAVASSNGTFYATYSFPLNIKVPKSKAVPYYCTNAYRSTDDNTTNANLKVVFDAVKDSSDGYYYLQANQGYLFKGTKRVESAKTDTVMIKNPVYMSGELPGNYDVSDKNIMVANLTGTTITDDNWASIYALTYNDPRDIIGYYYGNPVNGMGMGFYHIRRGGSLKPQTAYIPRGKFVGKNDEVDPGSGVHETSIPAEMLFEDQDGNIVDRVVVLPDGTWQSQADDAPVYDLTGRRVTKPKRGIYIKNGRKVMYTK